MRPKKKAAEKKEGIIRIRVTDAHKRAFEAAAEKEGMDLSTFARVSMLEKARKSGLEI